MAHIDHCTSINASLHVVKTNHLLPQCSVGMLFSSERGVSISNPATPRFLLKNDCFMTQAWASQRRCVCAN